MSYDFGVGFGVSKAVMRCVRVTKKMDQARNVMKLTWRVIVFRHCERSEAISAYRDRHVAALLAMTRSKPKKISPQWSHRSSLYEPPLHDAFMMFLSAWAKARGYKLMRAASHFFGLARNVKVLLVA